MKITDDDERKCHGSSATGKKNFGAGFGARADGLRSLVGECKVKTRRRILLVVVNGYEAFI